MPKFIALVPFAYEHHIFNPSDKHAHDLDNEELVKAWEAAEYCEIVGPSDPKKEEIKEDALEASNEPIEQQNDEAIEKDEEAPKEPEIEEKTADLSAFDSMSYPELKKAAKEAGIKGYNTMKQVDLIKVLKGE